MRILFAGGGTGGHLYPGLAIARAAVRLDPTAEPFFIGARRGIETQVLPTTEFPHALLDLHPLYRTKPWQNWRTLRGAATAWSRLAVLAREHPPRALVATGGYAAGIALGYAMANGIPFALQEQNSHPGLTTRVFSRRAREAYLGFPEAARMLAGRGQGVYVDTGNPIEPPPATRPPRAAARARWGFPDDGETVLLVFGGSQGARALNEVMRGWITATGAAGFRVIWATGRASYDEFKHLASERVRVEPYLAPIADAYAATDLALVRGGAMGTAELCAWGVPMIVVPLPTAAADHQTANARALAAAGAALFVPQRDLNVDALHSTLSALVGEPERLATLARGARSRARPDAAAEIARRVLAIARGEPRVEGGRGDARAPNAALEATRGAS